MLLEFKFESFYCNRE